jgi:hypothetical protein
MEQPDDQRGDPRQRPALVLHPAVRGRTGVQLVLQSGQSSIIKPAS